MYSLYTCITFPWNMKLDIAVSELLNRGVHFLVSFVYQWSWQQLNFLHARHQIFRFSRKYIPRNLPFHPVNQRKMSNRTEKHVVRAVKQSITKVLETYRPSCKTEHYKNVKIASVKTRKFYILNPLLYQGTCNSFPDNAKIHTFSGKLQEFILVYSSAVSQELGF